MIVVLELGSQLSTGVLGGLLDLLVALSASSAGFRYRRGRGEYDGTVTGGSGVI